MVLAIVNVCVEKQTKRQFKLRKEEERIDTSSLLKSALKEHKARQGGMRRLWASSRVPTSMRLRSVQMGENSVGIATLSLDFRLAFSRSGDPPALC